MKSVGRNWTKARTRAVQIREVTIRAEAALDQVENE